MCGRFRVRGKLIDDMPEDEFRHVRIRYTTLDRFNIGPGQIAPIIWRNEEAGLSLDGMRWRQHPFYLARAESVDQVRSWKPAFRDRRCLILMNGFYEWDERTKPRQPWHFHLRDDGLMMVAGLWTKTGSQHEFTLITTTPNTVVAQAHHRMPAMITSCLSWLDPRASMESLKAMLQPTLEDKLEGWPVSLYVNKVANEGPKCIERYEPPPPAQLELEV